MPSLIQTFRQLRRRQQTARVLTRYGFGHLLIQLGIGRAIAPRVERLRFSAADILRATPSERVRNHRADDLGLAPGAVSAWSASARRRQCCRTPT